MRLYIREVDYGETTFPQEDPWGLCVLSEALRGEVVVQNISSAPAGKHSLDECAIYEERWREQSPEVISLLRGKARVCLVWAMGPMDWNGLVHIFPYMIGCENDVPRYHVESVTFLDDTGYRSSWVAFEFYKRSFTAMIRDDALDLEIVRLFALIIPEGFVQELITRSFHSVGLGWIVEHDAIALAPHRHFEGYYALGRRDRLGKALEQLRRGIKTTDSNGEHER